MILFVFEGECREPAIFKTLQHLFFEKKEDSIICSYNNNIYELYKAMTEDCSQTDSLFILDIVSVLKERWKTQPSNQIHRIESASDVSEVYLFFDYDIHHQNFNGSLSMVQLNSNLSKLLEFFNDETGNGKLYISYLMVEAIRYTKQLPDKDYHTYTIPVDEIGSFKKLAAGFSSYSNLDFACLHFGKKTKKLGKVIPAEAQQLKVNWSLLTRQNVSKANFICSGKNEIPFNKDDVSGSKIFHFQTDNYFSKGKISVLSSFPLFLFDYFPVEKIF